MAFSSSVSSLLMVAMVVATIILEGSGVASATNHVVGDSYGWRVPANSSVYTDWSSSQAFALGDSLVFNFKTGQHLVIQVTKSGYDSCSPSDKIGNVLTNGPAIVTLNATGTNYFICGFPRHCSFGQKLAITVGSTAPASEPAPVSGGPDLPPPSGSAGEPTSSLTPGGDKSAGMASLPGFSLTVVVLLVASSLMF